MARVSRFWISMYWKYLEPKLILEIVANTQIIMKVFENHWRIQGSRGVPRTYVPSLWVQFFWFSCSFWGKLDKLLGWHPHLYGWRLLLWEILGPSLKVMQYSMNIRQSVVTLMFLYLEDYLVVYTLLHNLPHLTCVISRHSRCHPRVKSSAINLSYACGLGVLTRSMVSEQ